MTTTRDTGALLADVPIDPDTTTPAGRIGLRRDVDPTLAADLVKLHENIEAAEGDASHPDVSPFGTMRSAARLALRLAVEQASNNAAALRRIAQLQDQLAGMARRLDEADTRATRTAQRNGVLLTDVQRAERAGEARAADLRSALATVDQLRAEAAAQQRQLLALLGRYLEQGEELELLRSAAADAATSFPASATMAPAGHLPDCTCTVCVPF